MFGFGKKREQPQEPPAREPAVSTLKLGHTYRMKAGKYEIIVRASHVGLRVQMNSPSLALFPAGASIFAHGDRQEPSDIVGVDLFPSEVITEANKNQ